ncbi:ComF family protein [Pseudomonas aeruginosa]|uniref:ComF family protein n=1 Tax=Pseudomonas aeruginosa TaxID=287 RepID=UPI00070AF5B5|nr:phosphoribosyltransferase family protein [Pseudomonas aeruginosa]NNB82785.1 phosphoribosyltransferase [Pseudomonas aeruginosa]RUB31949.1 hypothetical protein IPC1432_16325 [Pseudomonas aeruginosa]HCD6631976.1 phosphoribosyltransferase [Pseudomonas aeruginosa]HCD7569556.1 phosphoribosyltransferase [Pseudomonas aeruginosa]HCZ9130764.1 phosphoribosyltransferase [Pseudomonas aeruginosa]
MGIDVRDVDGRHEVLYNANHQNLLDTSTERKPHLQQVDQLVVSSVFRRRKARGGDGDGNPFIYALKGLNRYHITRNELWAFRPNFLSILGTFMAQEPYDRIVPMPSSKPIARYVAKKAQRLQPECQLDGSLFRKRTTDEILPEVEARFASGEIPSKLKKETGSLLSTLRKAPGTEFSMKHVHQRLRDYVSPLALNTGVQVEGARILLVDDLLSSGSTLRTAHQLLLQAGATHVSALCLLSRV